MPQTFPQRLLQARQHAGLSQIKLVKAIGMAQSTYNRLEKSGGSSGYTPAIAQRCGVSIMWLATGAGEMLDLDYHEHRADPAADPLGDTKRIYCEEIGEMLSQFTDRHQLRTMYSRFIGEYDKYRAELQATEAPELTHAPSVAQDLPNGVAPKRTPAKHP